MAVTTDPFIKTDLDPRINEIWTPMVLEEMFAATVAANFFTNLTPYFDAMGGDIAHILDVYTNSFTVQTQGTQGAEITTEGPAQADVTLTLDTHKYIATILGDFHKQLLLKSFDFAGTYAKKMGGSLADALEDAILALWSGLTGNTASGDTATVLTDLEVRTAIARLVDDNFDVMRRAAWFVHPNVFWLQLAGIAKYYDASQIGANPSIVRSGNFGSMDFSRGLVGALYGLPIYTSTNIVSALGTYRNLLALPEAFGYALTTPGGSKVRIQSENALRNLGTLTVADIMYGVAEIRDKAAVLVNASNTATTS
jgi:hypothetical protein